MGLKEFIEDFMMSPLGGCFRVECPHCKHVNRIPKGDLICWTGFEQYAKYYKEQAGEYPLCQKCGKPLVEE